ncbi:MAG: hypothetical protein QME90_00765 [Thermodesulfobacteriota bacterium]|nr:hypothetical protein [Thermodesulfobacteriota bacterium]
MKKILSIFSLLAIIFLMGAWAPHAYAVSSGNVTVTVTIQNLSVSLSGATTWDLGTIPTSSVKTMTSLEKIIVTNDGNVTESFTLSLTNPSGWAAGSTAGFNTYVMKGLFVSTTDNPLPADFGADGNDVIETGIKTATDVNFGKTGSANGASVPSTAGSNSRALWLQFSAPTSTSATTAQSITITIGVAP